MPGKRAAFSVDERKALRAHYAANSGLSQRALCDYLDEASLLPGSRKRQRLQAYPDLERMLQEWVVREQNSLTLTGDVVRAKAQFFWNQLPQYDGLPVPAFSDGWISRFKARSLISSRRRHGEAANVDKGAMAADLARVQATLSQYPLCDQYNCDETGLFWKLIPDRSHVTRELSGVKKEKARITIHHCCNATGSHKLPMWIIGKHKRPRAFEAAGLKSVDALGITWRANKKAWMVTEIMVDWLRWFDRSMAGRKVILMMDNLSAHQAAVSELAALPQGSGLINTEICFLSPNTTKLQPLDQGIVASFKARYRKRWTGYMLEQHELGFASLERMNVLKAVQWSIRAWDEVTTTTITNCWSHSRINVQPKAAPPRDEIVAQLQSDLQQLSRERRVHEIMDVNQLLTLAEEAVVDGPENIDAHLATLFSPPDEQESDTEGIEPVPQVLPREVLRLLQFIKLGEMQSDDCNADYINWIERYEQVVQKRHIRTLTQAGSQVYFTS
ncbi:hypothetical protein Q7P37_002484 [Cladosporium fusiforme]